MKVLVTGGTGFIGSHVVETLSTAGHQPIVLSRNEPEWSTDRPLYVLGDITDYQVVSEAVARSEGVIHLAGALGTVESLAHPEVAAEVNILGSLNVFDACRFHKKRCVNAGVGNPDDNNPYAISKHTAERFALMYNREHRTQIACLRIFNVYGEGQKAEPVKKLIPSAIRAALEDQPITVYGGGLQQNDFIYVKDVAANLIQALLGERLDPHRVYELGTGVATPVRQAVELIIRLAQSASQIVVHNDRRPGEKCNVLVARREHWIDPAFHFTPLQAGLERTIVAAAQRAACA